LVVRIESVVRAVSDGPVRPVLDPAIQLAHSHGLKVHNPTPLAFRALDL